MFRLDIEPSVVVQGRNIVPNDSSHALNLVFLAGERNNPEYDVELLCDVRHRLRNLSVDQLREVRSVIMFIESRDASGIMEVLFSDE